LNIYCYCHPKKFNQILFEIHRFISKLLPDIKYIGINSEVIIRRGILAELYSHGVTRDQASQS